MQTETGISKRLGWALVLFFVVIYLLPLGIRSLNVPDEMRYGEMAREMVVSGDWVVPHLNGLRYFEKPAGGHAFNAAAIVIFGETNFAVRFMSALLAGLSALGIFLLLRSRTSIQTALFSAFIFLTMGLVLGIGTFSVLDSMVSGFITLTLCSFYAALDAAGKRKLGWLVLTGIFAGLAFLVKGFIALAVPVIVIVPFLMLRRDWKALFTLPWIPLISALVVTLPWCLAIAHREPDFWRYFFWEEHIHRFFSQEEAQHAAPFWYFIPVLIGGALPWTLVAIRPLRNLIREHRRDPLIQFALCWTIFPFLFFSASSGKLATYILPCFAPLAILVSLALNHSFKEDRDQPVAGSWAIKFFYILFILVFVVFLVALLLGAFKVIPLFEYHIFPKIIVPIFALFVAIRWLRKGCQVTDGITKNVLLGISISVLFVGVSIGFPSEVSTNLGIQNFLQKHRNEVDKQTILVGNSKTVHALCYEYKRNNVYLFRNKGELRYGLSFPDAQHRYLKDPCALQDLLAKRGSNRLVLVIKSKPNDALRAELPKPNHQFQWLKIWYAVYEPLTPKSGKK